MSSLKKLQQQVRGARIRVYVTLIIAAVAGVLSSYSYLDGNERGFFFFWDLINVVPGFFSIILGGHAGSMPIYVIGTVIQWLAIGWILSWIVPMRPR